MNDIHDLLGAYVTDALEPGERTIFEAHLTACADCRGEAADLREVLAALADAHPTCPPTGLEDAVVALALGAARTTTPGSAAATAAAAPAQAPASSAPAPSAPATSAPVGPGAPSAQAATARPVRARDRRRSVVTWLALAASAVTIFAGGALLGRSTAPTTDEAVAGSMDTILQVALATDAAVLPVDVMGADSRVVVSDEMGKAAFLASDLPTPAKGMCYQVWRVAADGTKESAGTFTPDADGHVAVVLEGSPDTAGFVITTEPPGGSTAPTGDMVGQVDT